MRNPFWAALVAALIFAPVFPVHAENLEPFGLPAALIYGGNVVTKWEGVRSRMRKQEKLLAQCDSDPTSCTVAQRRFYQIVAAGTSHEGKALFGFLNQEANHSLRPAEDLAVYPIDNWASPSDLYETDEWSTPLESLEKGEGDCEDFAILKYAALIAAKVSEDDLRLVNVHDTQKHEDHMILAARFEGKWFILDNRTGFLVEDKEIKRYTPLSVLDQNGVRRYMTPIAKN